MLRLYQKKFIPVLIAFLVLLLQFLPNYKVSQKSNTCLVKRIVDGDTIELENGQIVRYIGIDTPELHHPKKEIECFATAAAEFNKNLVEGKIVYLEKDVSETDRYKRLLRYVYIVDESSPSSKIFVNQKMVEEGYASAATFPPDVKYAELFNTLQEAARKNNKGMWEKCR